MNALTPLARIGKGSFKASGDGARAVQNASNSAHLQKDDGEPSRQAPQQRPRLQVELVSQTETKRHDPFWDGPRLRPAFVTQLLGQVMEPEPNRVLPASYGVAAEKSARLLDTRF